MTAQAKTLPRWKEPKAKFVGTLVYLDEPQVVFLDHGADAKIIGVAIDREGMTHGFLGAEISFHQWERYKRQFVDLRYLFLLPRWKRWFLFDLAEIDLDRMVPVTRATEDVYKNEDYLPSHHFFAREHTAQIDEIVVSTLKTETYYIDGTWDPADLSLFFGRINDLYSFFLGLKKFVSAKTTLDQKRGLVEAFTDNSLHSGFNYVNLFGDLKGLVGFDERLAMGAIQKASPGFVEIEGQVETLGEVTAAFANYSDNSEELKDKYNELHSYLSRGKLLTKNPARFDPKGPVAKFIREKAEEFSAHLEVDYGTLDKLTGGDSLKAAKILLSFHRRLERYQLFFAEGRVTLDDPKRVASSPSIALKPDA